MTLLVVRIDGRALRIPTRVAGFTHVRRGGHPVAPRCLAPRPGRQGRRSLPSGRVRDDAPAMRKGGGTTVRHVATIAVCAAGVAGCSGPLPSPTVNPEPSLPTVAPPDACRHLELRGVLRSDPHDAHVAWLEVEPDAHRQDVVGRSATARRSSPSTTGGSWRSSTGPAGSCSERRTSSRAPATSAGRTSSSRRRPSTDRPPVPVPPGPRTREARAPRARPVGRRHGRGCIVQRARPARRRCTNDPGSCSAGASHAHAALHEPGSLAAPLEPETGPYRRPRGPSGTAAEGAGHDCTKPARMRRPPDRTWSWPAARGPGVCSRPPGSGDA
jgi:hypothetical protein